MALSSVRILRLFALFLRWLLSGGNLLALLVHSSLMAKAALAVLFWASVVSWGIMGAKLLGLGRVRKGTKKFLAAFQGGANSKNRVQASREASKKTTHR